MLAHGKEIRLADAGDGQERTSIQAEPARAVRGVVADDDLARAVSAAEGQVAGLAVDLAA